MSLEHWSRESPVGARLVLAGEHKLTGPNGTTDNDLHRFVEELGREIVTASSPFVLVTGGRREPMSTDFLAVRGAVSTAAKRVVTYPPPDWDGSASWYESTDFTKTFIAERSPTSQVRRFRMLRDAVGVISVAGDRGTRDLISLGMALELVVLPLSFTGGASADAWRNPLQKSELLRQLQACAGAVETLQDRESVPASDTERGELVAEIVRIVTNCVRKKIFVMLPYEDPVASQIYESVLRPLAEEFRFDLLRTDREGVHGNAIDNLKRQIVDADGVIALLSDARREQPPLNGNVLFELGYSHASGLESIIMAHRGTQLPFDISAEDVVWVPVDSADGIFQSEIRKRFEKLRTPRADRADSGRSRHPG